MTHAALGDLAFHHGTQRITADAVHTTPLGYDREALSVGAPLPVAPSQGLTERLGRCTEVEIAFRGKLGDSLLALSTARAVLDWLALRPGAAPTPVHVRASGPYTDLVARTGLINQEHPRVSGAHRVIVTDRGGAQTAADEQHLTLLCDPAAPPCWSSNGTAHPALPDRHYLALERRLGQRLCPAPPFTPTLIARPSRLVHRLRTTGWFDGITVAAITATSRPDLKDYTTCRFIDVARHLADALRSPVRLLLIGGRENRGARRIAAADPRSQVQALHLDGNRAADLADLFPHCALVVGNDTGLTHLAALTRHADGSGPPVIGLYARHSHSKWRTGLPHHHALATAFSQRMHQGDLCPVRDALSPEDDAHLDAITPEALAQFCMLVLTGLTSPP